MWDYFNSVDILNDSHKGAECTFCSKTWKRGKPSEMKAHLALKCGAVPLNVKMECLNMIKNDNIPAEQPSQRSETNEMDNNDLISEDKIVRANKALVRFFVCCGIPFSIVDSPFF